MQEEKVSSFGCFNLRLKTTAYHETKSQIHQNALSQVVRVIKTKRTIIMTLNDKVIGRMAILFRNVHALVKMRRPFSDFM